MSRLQVILEAVNTAGRGVIPLNEMADAIRLYYHGEIFESKRILKKIINKEPENIGALIRYAAILEELGRKEIAGKIYLKLAGLYQKDTCYEDCLEALEKASSTVPQVELAPLKGTCLYHMGRFEEALSCFSIASKSIQNLFHTGKIYFALKQYDNALKIFREIMSGATNNDDIFLACYWVGKSLYALGKFSEAISCLQSYVSVYQDKTQALLELAICFLESGSLEEAERHLLKYKELDGNIDLANLYLGILNYRKGSYEQAVEYLNETSSSEQSMHWKGLAYYELGLYEEAVACFYEAAKKTANPLYFKMMGSSHLKLGNYFEAKICLEKALDADPADEELSKLIAVTGHYLGKGELI
ncbi:tetratricopeptide repeat protein [Pelotomaculum terephthalicicum JT]|uniref:tetratricopeptide repeat protein n=2 Tax=Pelotomaculum TaxID=191373 RepID=UPI0009D5E0C9|nr:tetratricopeptide repeat protein [Pelotomaculum terephthalicicum]MCG9966484.1 tetratricopeptide repeat protein [Pelotomaculum terephthalicicum JT]OPX85980.1 MAG: Tetratricopeptide repeat protein [Pelotomaculum sp. PtaB.Bin117]OPY63376.1 MAG: Tetratricopeptide repeat protein [Pelotomaculum sp. PtaU1.Bin065]